MILILLYLIGGLYLVLMSFGLLHRKFVLTMGRNRRLGLFVLGAGFFLLGINFTYYYTVKSKESFKAPEIYKEMHSGEK